MKQVFEIAFAIIASVGGASVVILGLSSFLGKVWANRILENEKKQHQLEIEKYKAELAKQISHLNSTNDKAIHMTKSQYDKEFEIYQEIWEKLNDCITYTLNLYPAHEDVPTDQDIKKKWTDEKWKKFTNAWNDYARIISRYAPFYKREYYDGFVDIRINCLKIGDIFKYYNYDIRFNETYKGVKNSTMTAKQHTEVYATLPELINTKKDMLLESIHDYLKSLTIISK